MNSKVVSIFLIGGIFVIAGCSGNKPKASIQEVKTISTNSITGAETGVDKNFNRNLQRYVNGKSGFSLLVPKEWTFKEGVPSPFVATTFYNKNNKQIIVVDRFQISEGAIKQTSKDLVEWAKLNIISVPSEGGSTSCEDGSVRLINNDANNYGMVEVTCPQQGIIRYHVFSKNRHYEIRVSFDYKKNNKEIWNTILNSFKIE